MDKKINTAFVLGAGLGTRLRPLTDNRPKPLLPLGGRPMITFAFDHLIAAGINRIIVNTHHCAERYRDEFTDSQWRGVPLIFRHEPDLLETGGGIKNIEDLAGQEALLVYNGDILSSLPLQKLISHHSEKSNEVTLALRSSGGPLHIGMGSDGLVGDIRGMLGAGGLATFLFTGIYIVEPQFFSRLTPRKKESVVPIFLDMIREHARLGGVVLDSGRWEDVGTPEVYHQLRLLAKTT